MRDLTPCRASRIAALRPTGPDPTTRTGVSAEVARSTMRQAPKSGPKRKRPILAPGLLHAKAQTVLLALRSPRWKRPSFPRVSMSGGLDHSENAMGYIEHSLGRSETLLYRARFPVFYFIAAWGVLLASVLGALLVDANGFGTWWIGVVLVGVAAFFAILVPIWTTEIGLTNQRFIFKRGLLWRSTQELQLRAIEEVNLEQGLLGRVFNFGRLELRGTV